MTRAEWFRELSKQEVRYSSLLGFFAGHPVEKIVTHHDAAAFIGSSDERWVYLAVTDEDGLEGLLRRLLAEEALTAFATLEHWMVPEVRARGDVESELTCIRYILPRGKTDAEVPVGEPVRTLKPEDAPTICEHSEYGEYISREYIEAAISEGFSAGVEERGKLVAWATTHDDLAIGNLHVLPSHRRRGLGGLLVTVLAGKLREAGYLPVMNIEADNTASRGLATRLGFEPDRSVTWIKLASE